MDENCKYCKETVILHCQAQHHLRGDALSSLDYTSRDFSILGVESFLEIWQLVARKKHQCSHSLGILKLLAFCKVMSRRSSSTTPQGRNVEQKKKTCRDTLRNIMQHDVVKCVHKLRTSSFVSQDQEVEIEVCKSDTV